MSYLCGNLYEGVVGFKRTSEYLLKTKNQNDLDSYKELWYTQYASGFLKKYCILAELWPKNIIEVSDFKSVYRIIIW